MGDIVVEFKSQKKVKEERSSYGLITVTATTDTRPYTIKAVVDPKTEKELSLEAAYENGILSRSDQTYKTETGEKIAIVDAIHSGLVKAEFHGELTDSDKEETKVYAVNGVMDQKRKRRVSFSEALHTGLLDGEEGLYINNSTQEKMSITDAIMKGLIKARIVTDPANMDVNPEHKIVVSRLKSVQERVVKAVRAQRALNKRGAKK